VNPGTAGPSSFPLFLTRLRAAKASARGSITSASDAELLSLLEAGNHAALDPLFDRYAALIFGIGLRTIHDRGEAEDLVQDVFLHLCEKARGFDALRGSARSWIIQIAYRRAFDRRNYLFRRRFYDGTDVDVLANTPNGDGDEALDNLLVADELRIGISELTDRQRLTLNLFFFEGLDFREISERLGETIENTRHHYYRGLERLRRCIATQSQPGRK
jgi:RNA polymerase sigma-70 factor (ECF subfamily)